MARFVLVHNGPNEFCLNPAEIFYFAAQREDKVPVVGKVAVTMRVDQVQVDGTPEEIARALGEDHYVQVPGEWGPLWVNPDHILNLVELSNKGVPLIGVCAVTYPGILQPVVHIPVRMSMHELRTLLETTEWPRGIGQPSSVS